MTAVDLDDLLRASLSATTDAERADLGAQISRVPDVIREIDARLRSEAWDTRRLALHFVTRLAPPPAELTGALVTVLYRPLSREPFGEETVLSLVIAGVIAPRLTAHRWPIEQRVEWIERAIDLSAGEPPAERAAVVLRLARDTLAKLDAAIAADRVRYEARVAAIAERLATSPNEAVTMARLQAATEGGDDRHAYTAALWRAIAYRFPATARERFVALEHSLEALRWWASESTSGGEGMARMDDVHALEKEISELF